jgi:integrase
MPTVKLTDAAVQKYAAPKGERREYFDATLPGFGLRVAGPTDRNPEGRKSWVLFYRFRGDQKRLTLSRPYPALSLADARKEAGDAFALIDRGIDPALHRAEARAEAERKRDTVETAVAAFLANGMKGRKGRPLAAGYIEGTRGNFENHVLPRWRDRDLEAITRRDVIALLDAIAANEPAPGKKPAAKGRGRGGNKRPTGGPVAANRVLAALRAMFAWAVRRGLVEVNPCTSIERPGEETRRDRTLTADEMRELWPVFVKIGHPFGDFFRVLLLTGQRRSEVAGMRWADVDMEAGTWTLGADQTKAGRSHVVPLSQAAVAILGAIPRKSMTVKDGAKLVTKPSPWVFTTDGDAPISGFSKAKCIVDAKIAKARAEAEADPMAAWNVHDLRRTAATEMGRLGVPEFVIAKVLNHTSKGITGQVYNRYEYLSEKKHALETWGQYLTKLMQPRAVGNESSSAQAA